MSRIKINGKWYATKWYVSSRKQLEKVDGKIQPTKAIYVQYFETKKEAEAAEAKIDKDRFITYVDQHTVIDIEKMGVPAMFSLNPERTPVYEVFDITAVI